MLPRIEVSVTVVSPTMVARTSTPTSRLLLLLLTTNCFSVVSTQLLRPQRSLSTSFQKYYDSTYFEDDDYGRIESNARGGGLASVLSPHVAMLLFALVFCCLFGSGLCLLRCVAQENRKQAQTTEGAKAEFTDGGDQISLQPTGHKFRKQLGNHNMAQVQGSMSTLNYHRQHRRHEEDRTGYTHDETTTTGTTFSYHRQQQQHHLFP